MEELLDKIFKKFRIRVDEPGSGRLESITVPSETMDLIQAKADEQPIKVIAYLYKQSSTREYIWQGIKIKENDRNSLSITLIK